MTVKIYDETLAEVPHGWHTAEVVLTVQLSPQALSPRRVAKILLRDYLDSAKEALRKLYPNIPEDAINNIITHRVLAYFSAEAVWNYELHYVFAYPPDAELALAEVAQFALPLWVRIVIILISLAVLAFALGYAMEKLSGLIDSAVRAVKTATGELNPLNMIVPPRLRKEATTALASILGIVLVGCVAGYLTGRATGKFRKKCQNLKERAKTHQ